MSLQFPELEFPEFEGATRFMSADRGLAFRVPGGGGGGGEGPDGAAGFSCSVGDGAIANFVVAFAGSCSSGGWTQALFGLGLARLGIST